MKADRLSERIIGAAIEVHRALGPGLLESSYKKCMVYELVTSGHSIAVECALPITYKELSIPCAYKVDLIVEGQMLVELKSVERIDRVHIAQVLTYLKLTGLPSGLLLNFNVPVMKDGIRHILNRSAV